MMRGLALLALAGLALVLAPTGGAEHPPDFSAWCAPVGEVCADWGAGSSADQWCVAIAAHVGPVTHTEAQCVLNPLVTKIV